MRVTDEELDQLRAAAKKVNVHTDWKEACLLLGEDLRDLREKVRAVTGKAIVVAGGHYMMLDKPLFDALRAEVETNTKR